MNLSDELLRRAAEETWEAMAASLPAPEDCAETPSPRFYRRMAPLLRRQRHPTAYQVTRRAAGLVLAALVGGTAWLAVDTDARAAFFQWVREVYETQIVYRFTGAPAKTEPEVYRPAWVPEGYAELDASDRTVIYYNEKLDQTVDFQYGPMQKGTSLFVLDADQTLSKEVEINETPGTLYLSTNPALQSGLVWLDPETGMAFSISGFLEESDIVHMAESISLVNSTN